MIYFVRHGESEANQRGLFAGQREDSSLTEKGKDQAKVTANHIKEQGIKIDKIISSPLRRTIETANIIANNLGIDSTLIKIDHRIMEYDMGSLTGTPFRNISSIVLAGASGAEDTDLFRERVHDCVREFSQSKENTLLVSHAGVGRILEATQKGMESKYFYDLKAWPNASITKIDWIG